MGALFPAICGLCLGMIIGQGIKIASGALLPDKAWIVSILAGVIFVAYIGDQLLQWIKQSKGR